MSRFISKAFRFLPSLITKTVSPSIAAASAPAAASRLSARPETSSFASKGKPEVREDAGKGGPEAASISRPTPPEASAAKKLAGGGFERGTTGVGGSPSSPTIQRIPKTDAEVKADIKKLIAKKPVVLFMKGSPDDPKCGFSKRAVMLLQEAGCTDVAFVDVLKSERVRKLIKEISDWPTIPQLFIGGKFVGGADLMASLAENGELASLIEGVHGGKSNAAAANKPTKTKPKPGKKKSKAEATEDLGKSAEEK